MSVAKSPFSKQIVQTKKPTGAGVDEFGNEIWTDEKGNVTVTKYSTAFTPVTATPTTTVKRADDKQITDADVNKAMRDLRTKGSKLDKKVMNNPNLSES